jgi:uncharacterized protein (DUF362 family)
MYGEKSPKVAVVRAEPSIQESVRRGLALIGGIEAGENEDIIIKPNLCHPSPPETGRTTDVRIVEEIIRNCGQSRKRDIRIVESDNYATSADRTFKRLGYRSLEDRYPLHLSNLSRESKAEMKIDGRFFETLEVPEFLTAPNYFISVAKLKVHLHELYTGAWKNQWGCLVQREKRCFHPFLNEALADVNALWKPRLCIVDGIIGMEGCGPIDGVPKLMNLLVFGKDPLAVDGICCHIMGIDPHAVPHLQYAYRNGFGTIDQEEIKILGEPVEKVRSQFALPPGYSVRLMRWGLRSGRYRPPLINMGLALFNLGNNYAGKKHSTRGQRHRQEKSAVGPKKILRKLWTTRWNV